MSLFIVFKNIDKQIVFFLSDNNNLHAYPMCHFSHQLQLLTCLREYMLFIGFNLNDVITDLCFSITELKDVLNYKCQLY